MSSLVNANGSESTAAMLALLEKLSDNLGSCFDDVMAAAIARRSHRVEAANAALTETNVPSIPSFDRFTSPRRGHIAIGE